MADITLTAANVVPANVNTSIARGTAGAAIAAGQPLWADPAASYALKPAQSTDQTQSGNIVGIALNTAATGQPVAYAYAGDLTVAPSLTVATVYVLGNGSGTISPSADLDASTNTRYGVVLGITTSATNLRLGILMSGVKNP